MFESNFARLLAERTGTDNFIQYNLGPFQQKHATSLCGVGQMAEIPDLITDYFPGKYCQITESGRSAIDFALQDLNVNCDDEIWIETTSNNFYISGCVTRAIEKHCKWSRNFSDRTKAVLINHEFGFPSERINEYRKYGLPIIEDCAFSFLSQNSSRHMGLHADYLIASFPKFLPVPFGGALYSKRPVRTGDFAGRLELNGMLHHYAKDFSVIAARRRENFLTFKELFSEFGVHPRFELEACHVPGVFMFRTGMDNDSLQRLKSRLNAEGIQSSVFYGEDGYFLPCHHELTTSDIKVIFYKTVLAMGLMT